MTLMGYHQVHNSLPNEVRMYVDDFDNDDEDDWKPKMKKQRITKTNNKRKTKPNKDVFVVVSPSTSQLNFDKSIHPLKKLWSVIYSRIY